ncbi:MAG: biotin--[acetyl-CoA-carboxylase] ligase [Burkholderiales bacterium]|nr:biotin--[acetyl-CoA-carboxylase] ligase [Burkholderiales bacterium]
MLTIKSFSLLRILDATHPCSGKDLAERLGVSRYRVVALIEEIERNGIPIDHVTGKGYRLRHPLTPVDVSSWERACLAFGAIPVKGKKSANIRTVALCLPKNKSDEFDVHRLSLEHTDCVDSTSSELMRRLAREEIHGHALVAEWQSAGRGRHGRPWFGLPSSSLTFSLGWRFEQGGGFLSGLPLAMSVAIARALEQEGFSDIKLKWPNDLVHHFRKFGGVLVELNGDALGPTQVVVGVGINITLPKQARANISQAVTDLSGIGNSVLDRNLLLARILMEMVKALALYAHKGFPAFTEEWQMRHAYHRRVVRLSLPGQQSVAQGMVVGVDADGALVLNERHGNGQSRYTVGEISLRRP